MILIQFDKTTPGRKRIISVFSPIRMAMLYCVFLCPSVVTLIFVSPPAQAQVAKLYPVDEASKDPDLYILRARLFEAIEKKDAEFVYAQLSPMVKLDFGGSAGVKDFESIWQPGQPDSKLWPLLSELLAGGGAFYGRETFLAPYWSSSFPNQFDAFSHGAIIGRKVNVRDAPSLQAKVLTVLSFDVVEVKDWYAKSSSADDPSGSWIEIALTDGRQAFVSSRYIRGPVGYRIGFARQDGRWRIQWFLAGD